MVGGQKLETEIKSGGISLLHSTDDFSFVDSMIGHQARITPDAIAVREGQDVLTYRELDEMATRLAENLISNGAGPERFVAILGPRSIDMVISVLAVLKSGAAYLPIDPLIPMERFANILDISRPCLIVITGVITHAMEEAISSFKLVPCTDLRHLNIGDLPFGRAAATAARSESNPAYVIFTSGSTGTPKGVVVEHASLFNHTRWFNSQFELSNEDKVVQRTSLSFDASIWEIFSTLTSGAQLWLVSDVDFESISEIETYLSEGATIIQCVPFLLRVLLESGAFNNAACLRIIFVGGDTLSVELARAVLASFHGDMVNLYGPTETTVDATWYQIKREGIHTMLSVPIGFPIDNCQISILDENGEICGDNEEGELVIAGKLLARGYLNLPRQTEERFVRLEHVFGGQTLYRTGDLGRRLPDGALEFLGRKDTQVKINGFRIDLQEINAILCRHAAVKEVFTIADKSIEGDRIYAYYTLRANHTMPSPTELRLYLSCSLPKYMLPFAYVRLNKFPLTISGKIDGHGLPPPAHEHLPTRQFESPEGELEVTISNIWREVLGLDEVNRFDNFFDLGGNSLQIVRIMHEVQVRLEVETTVLDFFNYPILADFAKIVSAMKGDNL